MAVDIAEQMEPLPGYRLIERLGSGGFGEVWKSTAPGGLLKAIKFVHGNLGLGRGEEGDLTALQEFKALQRVKDLHHPFILSLERVDVVEGQLVIVMELADCSLWDRYQECRNQGLPGIPRNELIHCLEEAAEALDVMNQECHVQHLDIKPQNLFLVRKHIKVADFGLAKDLEGTHAALTSGITPIYAAPETFEGRVSHFCDQYSLAIVYQELLTGQRPFAGKNPRQLLIQHIKAPPDLSALPSADRPAIARALAKVPTERFASCLEFVRALPREGAVSLPAPAAAPPVVPVVPRSAETKASAGSPTAKSPPPVPAPVAAKVMPVRRSAVAEVPAPTLTKTPANKPVACSATVAKPMPQMRMCPRCGTPLKKRASLGLCPNCGFCPTLEDAPAGTGLPTWVAVVVAVLVGVAVTAMIW